MRAKVRRKAHFNAAHRLFRPDWTDQKNEDVFGLCNNPYYHGHNYNLVIQVEGEIHPETGFVIDLKVLKELIQKEICEYLDHKNLNEQIQEFKNLNPTAENIAVVIYNRLKPHLDKNLNLEVELFETDRNSVIFAGN